MFNLSLAMLAACVGMNEPPVAGGAGVDPAATAWVKANAIAITTAEAGHGLDDLAGLDKVVGEARIVSLGEPTHGTREAFQMKHRLLEYLVEKKGFSIFSIEANMPEAYALNDYVAGGEGDPRKLIAGMYFWTWDTEEVLAMVEWMRAWNKANPGKPRLQFTGFDMQTSEVAAKIASGFLEKHAPDMAVQAGKAFDDVAALNYNVGADADGFTSATGTFPIAAAKGKKLVFSVWIKTENADGYAGAWWRCDTQRGVGGFNNMQDQGITGSTDWKRHEFTLDVDADTTNISFGFLLSGGGAAWFDDVEITLDGVKFDDPANFPLDFESEDVQFLAMPQGVYSVGISGANPHGGKKCLEIRKVADAPKKPRVNPVEAVAAAMKVLDAMVDRREALAAKAGAKETDWAIQNARVVMQRGRMFNVMTMSVGSNVRDQCMADNVEWILAHNPGAKIVLWAHNGHVSRGMMWGTRWMGSYLEKKFPGEMVVFGFAAGRGTYTAISGVGKAGLRSDHQLATPPGDSIEAVLASAGMPRLLLDIRSAKLEDKATAWACESRPMRGIGAAATEQQFSPCVAKDLYDVLVWQEETTASRSLRKKRQ